VSQMKLCIFGSRGCTPTVDQIDEALRVLEAFELSMGPQEPHSIVSELICGMARGADEAGYRWAKARNVPIIERPANWDRHGKMAGHIRNAAMAEECDFALGFWDGHSGGTANMAAQLASRHKTFRLIRWPTK